jgi:lipopolysaccharide transport protein LptA
VKRLRFFRVLLPIVLLPFLVVLALQLQPKPPIHNTADLASLGGGAQVESMSVVDYDGPRKAYEIDVGHLREEADGHIRLEDIHRLLVERTDASPLIIRAGRGGVDGPPGQRKIALEGGVEVEEEDESLRVTIPELDIDQVAGQAKSMGEVLLSSPRHEGTAGSVIYGLDGRPTLLFDVSLRTIDGETLDADGATLYDGTRDMELEGNVRLTRGVEHLDSTRMRVRRWPGGGVRHLVAQEGARGLVKSMKGDEVGFEADRIEVEWNEAGDPRDLRMYGHAVLDRGESRIAAEKIEATLAPEGDGSWEITASGDVRFDGTSEEETGELTSRSLRARITDAGDLIRARAVGKVAFVSAETRAEAAEILLRPGDAEEEVVLISSPERRARLSWSNTRVAAERIVTDRGGVRLDARGRVEATMLPRKKEEDERQGGLFQANEVVHFVSSTLHGADEGGELTFGGSVRSWQGDRTLSAEEVFIDQTNRRLRATGDANTRIPRDKEKVAVSQADYLQVSGDRLDYSERDALAVYTGSARVRQAEGWLEAERVEIALGDEGGVEEVRAFDDIRFEYRTGDEGETPRSVAGEGDQVIYTPADQTIWLYGEEKAATVQRGNEGGVEGRVLRYRLDQGTLRVESGDPDRVKIRTPEGGR